MITHPEHSRIRVIEGTIPVLISAPHTRPIAMRAQGGNITKPPELKVARLLNRVCRETGAWGVYMGGLGRVEYWEESTFRAYKRALRSIIEKNGVTLFIDLHGFMEARPFAIDYDFKISRRKPYDNETIHLEHIILKHLTNHDMGAPISKTFFSKQNGIARRTLTYFVRRTFNIPAVQFEINKNVREDPAGLRKLSKALYNIVTEWESEDTSL
ncbi:MAG: hypothetical protein WDZ44_00835 [Candidatus Spechtbacterales bacterium]